MFKPVYEDPVDTAEDIIARGLIPVIPPGGWYIPDLFAQSDNPLYRDLAMKMILADDAYQMKEFWDRNRRGMEEFIAK